MLSVGPRSLLERTWNSLVRSRLGFRVWYTIPRRELECSSQLTLTDKATCEARSGLATRSGPASGKHSCLQCFVFLQQLLLSHPEPCWGGSVEPRFGVHTKELLTYWGAQKTNRQNTR